MSSPFGVRTISSTEHLAFLHTLPEASFLQTPAWGRVKSDWKPESIGWTTDRGELLGVALVLYRQLPKIGRSLAYLPEGPVIDWTAADLGTWLAPMAGHLKAKGAFGIRIGPPVVVRRWTAQLVKDAIADTSVDSLTQLPPTEISPVGARVVAALRELGWRAQSAAGAFAAGQPQFGFVISLRDLDGRQRSETDVLASMNQLWRRNIKKAAKSGVEVTRDQPGSGLHAFHDLYSHTAQRDHFTPRPLSYFQTMFAELTGEDSDRIRLYLARHQGDVVAGTILIRVGEHTWYSYGASSTEKREVRGSNAIQWQMIRDAIAVGASVYDLRGITDTLDVDDDHIGLIQFKVGTGGEAVEYAGEWDLPLSRLLYKGFQTYLRRR